MGFQRFSPGCCGCGCTICVTACSGLSVYGALVQVWTDSTMSTLLFSCTTPSSGCCTTTISGSRYVTVSMGGSIIYAATRTLSGTVTIVLGSSAPLVCCGGYAIPKSFTATDGIGSFDFEFDPSYGLPLWTGGHSMTLLSSSVTTPNNVCLVATASYGPVRICYQMICHAGQNPTFSLQRSWSWVYKTGTFTPIYYQDSSGFAPGQLCITAPPPICGNPLTDTSSDAQNPSSTSPFVISFTPVPASSNALADPVGGTVTIS